MSYPPGSLVKTRGREWVVLPGTDEKLLMLRPLGGSEAETTGILAELETVESAEFSLPDPAALGDYRSCRLLRDAVRLGSRSSTGPFRSFARLAVEPRPYQLVPLLMALKLDPIRLFIADDVGIGKTIEACLIARELLDRGEINRIAVLCPPPLGEQWKKELDEKFHIEAELVLAGTASRLERNCRIGQSLFDLYPYVVVSMDFIKSDRRREEFINSCPEFVIVDEAHTCAFGFERRGGRHQRHQLIKGLAADPARHLLFVTATPHSGKEEAFRSLLALLKPDFTDLPEDLSGEENRSDRKRLARHFVQRRRADIRHYLRTDTIFPDREERECPYALDPSYKRLMEKALRYARETVVSAEGGKHVQRVRWWSAIALLRSLGSSPAAAADTLRNRAAVADTETTEEADEIGRATVLDLDTDEAAESMDVVPGSDHSDEPSSSDRKRLLAMAREAEQHIGRKDTKLDTVQKELAGLVSDGFNPIVFCRFIPTAHYVASELRKRMTKDIAVEAITGEIAPAERISRVETLAEAKKKILVCTDCLSEGINLQDYFDAVVHYDLSWNPTRHEQREGRVDRFNQKRETVRILTLYSTDNRIDGLVLDTLIRKHNRIRTALGVSVPVPVDTNDVVEALLEGIILRESWGEDGQQLLEGLEEHLRPSREMLHSQWETVADREKRSRNLFAQETIRFDEVAAELKQAQDSVGSSKDVERFAVEAFTGYGSFVEKKNGTYRFNIKEAPRALRDLFFDREEFTARFEPPAREGSLYLNRTHPIIANLASHIMDSALDPISEGIARRSGVVITMAVDRRTTLLLVRFRFDLFVTAKNEGGTTLCEECRIMAFRGAPDKAEWLEETDTESLLSAQPDRNIGEDRARDFVARVIEGSESLFPHIEEEARNRSRVLQDAHERVRSAVRQRGGAVKVEPHLPPDLLGIYVFLPAQAKESRP